MRREPLNDSWAFGPKPSIFEALSPAGAKQIVSLPHDAVLAGGRAAEGSGGSHTGYFFGGAWQYEKTLEAPAAWADRQVTLEFEGVYRDAMVYINGNLAGQCPNGYTRFFVDATPHLTYGGPNKITVEARAHEDSRWYSGGGLYRPVNLLVGGAVHLAPEGPRITPTPTGDDLATVRIDTEVVNTRRTTCTVTVEAELRDRSGVVVASERAPFTVLPHERLGSHLRLYLENPVRWDVANPYLYDAVVRVLDGDEVLDEAAAQFGVRTLELDPRKGLLVNGEVVNLRGCCIHHDNGIVGSATFEAAEERRLRILKEAGFNAVRSAHNPASRALLEACDRLGMFVMEEFSDVWAASKSHFDYHTSFARWWQRDVDAMVARDYNHPSVIMYSIGNEIMEVGTPLGARQGRLIADRIRRQDPSRVVLNSINCAIAAIDQLAALFGGGAEGGQGEGFNAALSVQDTLAQVMRLPMIGDLIEESCSYLDVVGYNYGDGRYLQDHQAHPNRMIVGSETFPTQIDHLWTLVKDTPHLIGDFAWVGWDYLGESGVGRVKYPDEPVEFAAPYPWLTTSSGDIDITGHRRAVSYYREVVFGLRRDPYLVVQDPAHAGHPAVIQAWSWNDATPSWTWDVPDGTPVTAEAYADADEVAFVLNGDEVARTAVGDEKGCLARASVPYRPGELTAVAYRDGEVVGMHTLRTAGAPAAVRATVHAPQERVMARDLEYVEIAVVDASGIVCPRAELAITVTVDGSGVLQGLGTGRQSTEESFLAVTCTTHQGRALAAIRPQGDGPIVVTVAAEGLPTASVSLA